MDKDKENKLRMFNEHYKVLYGDLILKEIDIETLRSITSKCLAYININCLYDDYLKYQAHLKQHLADQDIRISMFQEREGL